MKTWAVLASGPSMSQEVAESVRGRVDGVIVISDVYRLAPWADALVSNDGKWWRHNPDARNFAGRKFAGSRVPGCELIVASRTHGTTSNSGLQGIRVAWGVFGAERILLLGFDMHGTHFFGLHKRPLRNTSPERREAHKFQLSKFKEPGCRVVNCTPGSALECFERSTLEQELLQ